VSLSERQQYIVHGFLHYFLDHISSAIITTFHMLQIHTQSDHKLPYDLEGL